MDKQYNLYRRYSFSRAIWICTLIIFFVLLFTTTELDDVDFQILVVDVTIGIISFLVLVISKIKLNNYIVKNQNTTKIYADTKNSWKSNPITFLIIIGSITLTVLFTKYKVNSSITNWKFEDGKWKCNRTDFLEKKPEFNRALSLFAQRTVDSRTEGESNNRNRNVAYCIKVEVNDLETIGAEGLFYFDPNQDLDNLTIFVDKSFIQSDSIITAILLRHEITHVYQYLEEKENIKKLSCIEAEVDAFTSELAFIGKLNAEEWRSLYGRLETFTGNNSLSSKINDRYTAILELLKINSNAITKCKREYVQTTPQYDTCVINYVMDDIRLMVRNNPGYQEQCEL